ncbi:hypothetical protein [Geminisphaera colitermitum]|uniref:hypothetical protein n=1 Tax=Geminisphaera colitermitum TaxID=1148786 RepID=UPI0001964DBE|nr:hypothetical protein [Geminisphaera colitermitum]
MILPLLSLFGPRTATFDVTLGFVSLITWGLALSGWVLAQIGRMNAARKDMEKERERLAQEIAKLERYRDTIEKLKRDMVFQRLVTWLEMPKVGSTQWKASFGNKDQGTVQNELLAEYERP